MARRRLRDTGEHGWIAHLLPSLPAAGGDVLVGPGDDAGVVRHPSAPLVVTTDTMVEGVHFRRAWLSPAALGRRLFRANASDVAAMGGRPTVAVLGVIAPPAEAVVFLDGVVRGFARDARAAGAALVGGNLSRGSEVSFTVTMLGTLSAPPVRRAGARVGDDVWVTGTLGGMGWAVRRGLARHPVRLPEVPCRWDLARRMAARLHAMLDVSDGLLQDLGHLCRASGVGIEVQLDAVPVAAACRRGLGAAAARFAATSGEDYELAFTASPAVRSVLQRYAAAAAVRLSRIGRVVRGASVRVLDGSEEPSAGGFDHFARRGLRRTRDDA